MDCTGPLPHPPHVTEHTVLKSTRAEHGLSHLLEVLERIGDSGEYQSSPTCSPTSTTPQAAPPCAARCTRPPSSCASN